MGSIFKFSFILVTAALHAISCSQVQSYALTIRHTVLQPNRSFPYSCLTAEERESALLSQKRSILYILNQSVGVNKLTVPQCGDGLWTRIAYLNMSDSTQECPSNWTEISSPVRTCGRPTSSGPSCPSVLFSTGSLQYRRVCGRAIGFQDGSADAFRRAGGQADSYTMSVDSFYVDGLSVTYGGVPRTHIWTYAVGATESNNGANYPTDCPCTDSTNTVPAPDFVGNNYFCESGNRGLGLGERTTFFESDPVWDGEQCEEDCCGNGKSPPWFSVTLPSLTTDDIEVRICGDESTDNEDTPVQLLEIYIQ